MFALLEEAGFNHVRSAVVPGFRFRKASTQSAAEAYGVKAVMMTATKPASRLDHEGARAREEVSVDPDQSDAHPHPSATRRAR